MEDMIAATGFEKMEQKIIYTPLGRWHPDRKLRELGKWALLGFDIGLEGYAMATLTRHMGVSSLCPPFGNRRGQLQLS